MQPQALYSSSSPNPFPHPHPSPLSPVPLQQRIGPASEDVFLPEAEQPSSSDQKAQAAHIVVKTTSSDGFNWRKYGQKQVKSSETFRSYYRCTHTICSAKKKVEHCQDGRVTETIYRGQHNHDLPQKPKRSKERGSKSAAHSGENETLAIPSGENDVDPSPFKAEQNSSNEAPEQQFHCSSDCEGDTGIKTDKDTCDEPEPKRRISESPLTRPAPLLKTVRESKIVVQTACDGGLVSDGYRWRKYGQKIVKGNPNPRSYFKCTHLDCPVRKHVERASKDEKAVIVTYEGKHNHDLPTPKIAAMTSDGYIETSNSSSDQQMRAESQPYTTDGETAGEKALELGGEKVLESGQTLLSIGYNSSSEKNDEGNNSDAIQPPLFNENCAAVAVQNS